MRAETRVWCIPSFCEAWFNRDHGKAFDLWEKYSLRLAYSEWYIMLCSLFSVTYLVVWTVTSGHTCTSMVMYGPNAVGTLDVYSYSGRPTPGHQEPWQPRPPLGVASVCSLTYFSPRRPQGRPGEATCTLPDFPTSWSWRTPLWGNSTSLCMTQIWPCRLVGVTSCWGAGQ